jgi:hypothetical protein
MAPMTMHRQVRVRANGMDARVDDGMRDLIRECWRAHIYTWLSCQEIEPGKAWLSLPAFAAEKLIDALSEPTHLLDDGGGLFARIHGTTELDAEHTRWQYRAAVNHHIYPDAKAAMLISLRFPTSDIAMLTERLRRHNAHN